MARGGGLEVRRSKVDKLVSDASAGGEVVCERSNGDREKVEERWVERYQSRKIKVGCYICD